MLSECERWIERSDREALGERLSEEELALQRKHVASCAACASEAMMWQATKPPTATAAPDARELDAVMQDIGNRMERHRFLARRKAAVAVPIAAASLVACAAAVLLWFGARHRLDPSGATASGAIDPPAVATNPVISRGVPAPDPAGTAGERPLPPSCAEVVEGVTVCQAEGTEISRRVLDVPDKVVEIARGRVVVELAPQPAGTSFSIATSLGRVTAVGTIFAVEVAPDGSALARVARGRVLVRATADGIARSLRAGESLRIGASTPTPLSSADRARDLALLGWAAQEQPAGEPSSRIEVGARAGAEPRAGNESARSGGAAASHGRGSSPEDLIEQASALRASGQFAQAAEIYRKIYALNPRATSGLAALVSLGEVLLSSLGDPAAALDAFEAYLNHGGALAQEAAYGKARALRALDRTTEEKAAIVRFLSRYPDAPQSRVLRHRLTVLGE